MVEERIAALEVEVKALKEANAKSLEILEAIRSAQLKQKGFLGGVVFVTSALWTFAIAAFQFLSPTLGKKVGL